MQITIASVTFLVGLSLIVIAIVGGGLEIKEVKIPKLPLVPRAVSFIVGIALLVLCLGFPHFFPAAGSADNSATGTIAPGAPKVTAAPSEGPKAPLPLGANIRNQSITVSEVKLILRRLGKYNGPINDEASHSYFQAVVEFQLTQNIEADGLVGPVTYVKLREVAPEFFQKQSEIR